MAGLSDTQYTLVPRILNQRYPPFSSLSSPPRGIFYLFLARTLPRNLPIAEPLLPPFFIPFQSYHSYLPTPNIRCQAPSGGLRSLAPFILFEINIDLFTYIGMIPTLCQGHFESIIRARSIISTTAGSIKCPLSGTIKTAGPLCPYGPKRSKNSSCDSSPTV